MEQVLHWGLLQGREPVGVETHVDNELEDVRRFWKMTEGPGLMDPRRGYGNLPLGSV